MRAAVTVSWELRFQFEVAVAGERRELRRPAGRVREPRSSADVEIAVGATAGDEGENRPVPEWCRRCRRWSGWGASRGAVERRRSRCRREGRPRGVNVSPRAGSTETSVRPAAASVGSVRPERCPERNSPPVRSGRRTASVVCCVLIVCRVFGWFGHCINFVIISRALLVDCLVD